jgi:hypothetical protein
MYSTLKSTITSKIQHYHHYNQQNTNTCHNKVPLHLKSIKYQYISQQSQQSTIPTQIHQSHHSK